MADILLELKKITKSFDGEPEVLRGISLAVERGEFLTLLGASGCGKTTTLRIIAGLETPDAGSVYLDGKDVTDLEPNQRNVNTVFQNYALFPHMNVADNVGYSLKLKKVPKAEREARVREMLELVQLSGFEKRRPDQLSGGQRQRVAIARSLIGHPQVLLLDEPLGALDLKLRRAMQIELKRLQKKLGITFIYITHDQEEAINMSDRIAVMRDGNFEQVGTPDEIYNRPKTSYVAEFVGNANLLTGTVGCLDGEDVWIDLDGLKTQRVENHSAEGGKSKDGSAEYDKAAAKVSDGMSGTRERTGEGKYGSKLPYLPSLAQHHEYAPERGKPVTGSIKVHAAGEALRPGESVTIALRGENIRLDETCAAGLPAVVREKSFAGGHLRVLLVLSNGKEITANRFGLDANVQPGQPITWNFDPKDAVLVDRENTKEQAAGKILRSKVSAEAGNAGGEDFASRKEFHA